MTVLVLKDCAVQGASPRPGNTPAPQALGRDLPRWIFPTAVVLAHAAAFLLLSRVQSESVPEPPPIEVQWIPPAPEAAPPPAAAPEASPAPLPMAPAPEPLPPVPAPPVLAAAEPPSAPSSDETAALPPPAPLPSPATLDAPVSGSSQGPAGEPSAGGDGDRTAEEADYLTNPAPEYPLASRLLGEEGRVLVRALVDAKGLPLDVRLEKGCGHDRLDRSAVAVVRHWKFRPAKTGSQARSGWVVIPIRFSLRRSR